jgi:chromosome segregation protein
MANHCCAGRARGTRAGPASAAAKIGSGKDARPGWPARPHHARRLWQQIDIEPGWEDALEGVLRERLNALELPALDAAAGWTAGGVALPGRIAAYAPGGGGRGGSGQNDALLAKVKGAGAGLDRVLGDWLAGMRCRDDLAGALRDRGSLSVGEAFVTPAGHVVTAQSVGFAPDSDLPHGVLARQREPAELIMRSARRVPRPTPRRARARPRKTSSRRGSRNITAKAWPCRRSSAAVTISSSNYCS